MLGILAAVWGIAGVVLVLLYAVVRLTPIALDAVRTGMSPFQWLAFVVSVAFMLYSEGYRGFQKSFSIRVAERAVALRDSPTLLRGLLAPLYCIGYFAASRQVKITVYLLTAAIIVMVRLVHYLDQPWRGILDAGVVGGLSWGIVATLGLGFRALTTRAR